jgi:hypothetical protein
MSRSSRRMLLGALLCIGTQANVLDAQRDARNGTIMGTVLDSRGNPIPSEIMVYRWLIVNGRANPGAMCSTQTNADGHYECHHLTSGNFAISAHSLAPFVPTLVINPSLNTLAPLSAQLPPATSQKSEPQEAYPLTFYPDVTDVDSAVKIASIEDATETADITVHAVPVHDIHGILPSTPSNPEIALRAHTGFLDLSTPFSASYDAATGQFSFNSVPEGTYEISADWATQTGAHHGETLVVLSSIFEKEVKIEDQPVATIRGLLHYASTPAPQLPPSVTISSKDINKRPYTAAVGPDGSFSIPTVIDGEYELSVSDANGAYIRSITMAGKEVSPRRILVVGGHLISVLDVGLGTSTATISGIVNAQQVIPERTGVIVQPAGSDQVLVVLANQQRHFRLQNLPPGDYRLYAWDDLKDVEYRNPRYLKTFQNKSTTLTVNENEPITDVELTTIDADR